MRRANSWRWWNKWRWRWRPSHPTPRVEAAVAPLDPEVVTCVVQWWWLNKTLAGSTAFWHCKFAFDNTYTRRQQTLSDTTDFMAGIFIPLKLRNGFISTLLFSPQHTAAVRSALSILKQESKLKQITTLTISYLTY